MQFYLKSQNAVDIDKTRAVIGNELGNFNKVPGNCTVTIHFLPSFFLHFEFKIVSEFNDVNKGRYNPRRIYVYKYARKTIQA